MTTQLVLDLLDKAEHEAILARSEKGTSPKTEWYLPQALKYLVLLRVHSGNIQKARQHAEHLDVTRRARAYAAIFAVSRELSDLERGRKCARQSEGIPSDHMHMARTLRQIETTHRAKSFAHIFAVSRAREDYREVVDAVKKIDLLYAPGDSREKVIQEIVYRWAESGCEKEAQRLTRVLPPKRRLNIEFRKRPYAWIFDVAKKRQEAQGMEWPGCFAQIYEVTHDPRDREDALEMIRRVESGETTRKPDPEWNDRFDVAESLAKAGDVDKAREVARGISEAKWQARAFLRIYATSCAQEDIGEVARLVSTIVEPSERAYLFAKTAHALSGFPDPDDL